MDVFDGHTSRGYPGSSSHLQHTTNRHQNNVCAVRCRTVCSTPWCRPRYDHLHPSTAATRCRALVPQQHKHKHSGEVPAGSTKTTTGTSSKNIELCHPSHDGNVSHRGWDRQEVPDVIIKDQNSLELDICEKQLTVKGSKSGSYLICITALLTKYNLPAPEHMLYSTPMKGTWKTLLLSRTRAHWYTHMYRLPMAERVGRGTPCLLWSLGVREVVGSPPAGAIVRRVFHPTRKLVRISLLILQNSEIRSPRGEV